ncbi:MAG: hypothetical protein KF691_01235 [Phycisphaeraceae bacterium]|nr:hypothetical protein [Phycisphaeraceae bacterium]
MLKSSLTIVFGSIASLAMAGDLPQGLTIEHGVLVPNMAVAASALLAHEGAPFACGLVETNVNGPWVIATSTGVFSRGYCGTCDLVCTDDPDYRLPGYGAGFAQTVNSEDGLLGCNSHTRYWMLAGSHAFVFPVSAIDPRSLKSFAIRLPLSTHITLGWWQSPDFAWELSPDDDFAPLRGFQLISSVCAWYTSVETCINDYSIQDFDFFYPVPVLTEAPVGDVMALEIGPRLRFEASQPLNLREKENSLALHTDRYKLVENPDRMIVRRAAAFRVEVTGENELDEQCSLIHFTATHTFDGDPVEIDIPLFEGSVVPPDAWGCRVVHVEGRDPKKLLVEVLIPKDAAIGEYTFNAQFRPNGRPEILDEVEFPKKVVVLFNPWGEEDEVYYSTTSDLGKYMLNETIQLTYQMNKDTNGAILDDKKMCWDLDQFTEPVLDVTLGFLETLTSSERESATTVSRELSAQINAEDDGGLLVGRWPTNNSYPNGTSPFEWRSSLPIFAAYRENGVSVKYAQCWIYAGTFVSALRSVGIPSRAVSGSLAGQDSVAPFDGNMTVTRRWGPSGWAIDNAATDKIWDFHVWTEAWMKRTDLQLASAWQALDSSALPPAHPQMQIGPAAVASIKSKLLASQFNTNYFVSLVAPQLWVEDWKDGQKTRYSPSAASIGKKIWTAPIVGGEPLSLTALYKLPGAPPAPLTADGVATFTIAGTLSRGAPLVFTSHLANTAETSDTVELGYTVEQVGLSGYWRSSISSPPQVPYVLAAGESRDITITVPWSTLAPWVDIDTQFRVTLSAMGADFEKRAIETVTIQLIDPQVLLHVSPAGTVRFNDLVHFEASCTNNSVAVIQNARMILRSSGRLRFASNDRALSVSLGVVPVNGGVQVSGVARAVARGADVVSADFNSNQVFASSAPQQLNVVGCLGDLDGGDSVDDADFSLFAQSYNELVIPPGDPAADLNQDGVVDDSDFILFVQAYDRLLCE